MTPARLEDRKLVFIEVTEQVTYVTVRAIPRQEYDRLRQLSQVDLSDPDGPLLALIDRGDIAEIKHTTVKAFVELDPETLKPILERRGL